MKKFTVRYRLKGEATYRIFTLELPDMETAVGAGWGHAKGIHGIPVIELLVVQEGWINEPQ